VDFAGDTVDIKLYAVYTVKMKGTRITDPSNWRQWSYALFIICLWCL